MPATRQTFPSGSKARMIVPLRVMCGEGEGWGEGITMELLISNCSATDISPSISHVLEVFSQEQNSLNKSQSPFLPDHYAFRYLDLEVPIGFLISPRYPFLGRVNPKFSLHEEDLTVARLEQL